MEQSKIDRINELARKSKAEGLTEAEKKEQKINDYYEDLKLRQEAQRRFDEEYEKNNYTGNKVDEYTRAKIFFGLDSDTYTLDDIVKIRRKLMKAFHSDENIGDDVIYDRATNVNMAFDELKKHLNQ